MGSSQGHHCSIVNESKCDLLLCVSDHYSGIERFDHDADIVQIFGKRAAIDVVPSVEGVVHTVKLHRGHNKASLYAETKNGQYHERVATFEVNTTGGTLCIDDNFEITIYRGPRLENTHVFKHTY